MSNSLRFLLQMADLSELFVFHNKMASSSVLCFIRNGLFHNKMASGSVIARNPHRPRGFDQCSQKKLSALFNTVVKKMTYSVASYIDTSKRSVYGLLMLTALIC